MKICLVTGGAGFIGSNLVRALVREGRRVRVLDNFSAGKMSSLSDVKKDIEVMRGDVRRLRDCQKAVKGAKVVFHQAAFKSVPKSVVTPFLAHDACATGTLNMLEASKEEGVSRFIYASSSSVYGVSHRFPANENDSTAPLSPYGVAKLSGERYVYSYYLNHGLETVSLRYFNVFGPFQYPDSLYPAVIPGFISSLQKGVAPTIYGDGTQRRDFTYIDNVVRANILAEKVKVAKGHTLNIACGKDYSVLDVFSYLTQLIGCQNIQPRFKKRRPSDSMKSLADISKAKNILGWAPTVDFKEGLRKTLDWHRNQ